jgi:hypothetical protein
MSEATQRSITIDEDGHAVPEWNFAQGSASGERVWQREIGEREGRPDPHQDSNRFRLLICSCLTSALLWPWFAISIQR